MANFAERLRREREKLSLTQAALADKCGLTQTHISHFEAGRRLPSLSNFIAIGKSLGISLDVLAGGRRHPR